MVLWLGEDIDFHTLRKRSSYYLTKTQGHKIPSNGAECLSESINPSWGPHLPSRADGTVPGEQGERSLPRAGSPSGWALELVLWLSQGRERLPASLCPLNLQTLQGSGMFPSFPAGEQRKQRCKSQAADCWSHKLCLVNNSLPCWKSAYEDEMSFITHRILAWLGAAFYPSTH